MILSGSKMAIILLILNLILLSLSKLKKYFWYLLIGLFLITLAWPFLTEESYYESRARIWPKALLAIKERPLTGWGLENFEFAFESVLVPAKDIGLTDIRVDKAHNQFLEVGVASGLIGLGLYGAILFSAGRFFWKKVKAEKEKNWWLAVFSSLILVLLRAQVNPLSIAEQALLWFLIALSVSQKTLSMIKKEKLIQVIVTIGLLFMLVFNLRSGLADFFFKKGISLELIEPQKSQDFFSQAKKIFPWEEIYRLKASD